MNLSIKNVPDEIVEALRQRAARNHRSLQGELMAIIEAAAYEVTKMTPGEIFAEVQKLGLHSPREAADQFDAPADSEELLTDIRALGKPTPNESTAIVRADRGRNDSL